MASTDPAECRTGTRQRRADAVSPRRSTLNDPTSRLAICEDELLQRVLDGLSSQREVGVLTLRFGLTDGRPQTLDEIGRTYGVTRERIRQIEQKAIARLRHPSRTGVLAVPDGGLIDFRRRNDRLPTDEQIGVIRCGSCQRRFVPKNYAQDVGGPWSTPRAGRPRKYCSNRCRQAAYRIRKAQTEKTKVKASKSSPNKNRLKRR
ncbi:hypothetical protein DMH08_34495 [Actinomadura sp. WAC 06369]|nr:hypothetical protein DMH08_34495 [Actinomadura sp. WAC 06369]